MKKIVFYSWQSDLPNSTNRSFVQQALEKAVANIVNDDTVAVEPVVDRDTKGVAGAPDIASTIFAKITSSDVFVADVSIIAHPQDGRPTPNPNVLIELGYALKSLGHERIILVFNNSFGKIEELPFDLRTRRLMTYAMLSEEKNRAPEKLKLEKQLEDAIRGALENTTEQESESAAIPAITAIEDNKLNKIIIIRKNLAVAEQGEYSGLVEKIKASNEYSKFISVAISQANSDKLKNFNYSYYGENSEGSKGNSINFVRGDLLTSIGGTLRTDVSGHLLSGGKWALNVSVHDQYGFDFHGREYYQNNTKVTALNNSMLIPQGLGAISKYNININFSDNK